VQAVSLRRTGHQIQYTSGRQELKAYSSHAPGIIDALLHRRYAKLRPEDQVYIPFACHSWLRLKDAQHHHARNTMNCRQFDA